MALCGLAQADYDRPLMALLVAVMMAPAASRVAGIRLKRSPGVGNAGLRLAPCRVRPPEG